MSLSVRRPLHQGSQLVAGLWFDPALLGEDAARARLLGQWEAGARAYRVHGGYLLEWSDARRLHCAGLPGLALCRVGGILSSAPLRDEERASLAPGMAVLVLGASLHIAELGPATRIDPSRWLDVGDIAWAVPLSMPRGANAGFVSGIEPPAADLRAVLGDAVPAPSEERARFLRQAARERSDPAASGPAPNLLRRLGKTGAGLLGMAMLGAGLLGGGLGGLLGSIRLPFGLGRAGGAGGAGGTGTGGNAPGQPAPQSAPPSAPHGLRNWLHDRVAQLAVFTNMSRALGWRQSRYLQAMLREFENGNLDEALRRAIPLDAATPPGRMALGTPTRRGSLDISGPAGSATSIGLDEGAIALLRKAYQRSFDMLDRAGRIDEAVFVLAELLNRPQEAVDYLERHGRLAQAAQLAETLELAPGTIVRLHCMAGRIERAVLLARLLNAFGEAVAELERRGDASAAAMRLEWAQDLAARGEMVQAAAVLWPLKDERGRALAWLHAAEAAGGALGVQGLFYKLALDPESTLGSRAAIDTLLYEAGEEAAQRRALACSSLLKLDDPNATLRRLASALWRAILADHALDFAFVSSEALARLLKVANDRLLGADLPKGPLTLKDGVPLAHRSTCLSVQLAERGLLPVEDVCVLPDGGFLLALGEEGVALARADGTVRMRFPLPAHHLVLAASGQAALVLARRDKTVRIGRLDLVTRKMSDWFRAQLRFWAREYDGASWSVVVDNRLLALDTAAPQQSVLWQVDPGEIIDFDHHDNVDALLVASSSGVEHWRYVLPARRLNGREAYHMNESTHAQANAAWPYPLQVESGASSNDGASTLILHAPHGYGQRQLSLPDGAAAIKVSACAELVLVEFERAGSWHCRLVNAAGRVQAEVTIPEARGAQAGVRAGHLCAWDRCGRLVTVSFDTGAVRALTLH